MVTLLPLLALWTAGDPTRLPPPEAAPEATAAAPRLLTPTAEHQTACPRAGRICVFAGSPSTTRGSGEKAATLTRVARVAKAGSAGGASPGQPWDLELVAPLRAKTTPGTVLVLAFDKADPQALAHREATGLWELPVGATKLLGVQLRIDADAGFRAAHGYVLRIVQLLGKREVVLAEGEVTLE